VIIQSSFESIDLVMENFEFIFKDKAESPHDPYWNLSALARQIFVILLSQNASWLSEDDGVKVNDNARRREILSALKELGKCGLVEKRSIEECTPSPFLMKIFSVDGKAFRLRESARQHFLARISLFALINDRAVTRDEGDGHPLTKVLQAPRVKYPIDDVQLQTRWKPRIHGSVPTADGDVLEIMTQTFSTLAMAVDDSIFRCNEEFDRYATDCA